MKRMIAGLMLLAVLSACSDDEVTAPVPDTPINSLTLTQLGADSLLVTFGVTRSYGVAYLRTRSASFSTYSVIDSIPANAVREFRTRWTDWVFPPDTYGWVAVEIGWGTNNRERYAWFQQFTPAP